MKKRLLTLFLAICMVCTLLPVGAFADDETSGTCGDDATWTFKDGVLTISGTGEIEESNWHYYDINSVVINKGITAIGDWAFAGCNALQSISIPTSVTSIGWGVFKECTALESVTLPSGLTSIENHAFQECTALKSVSIPSSVKSIGELAFLYCTALKSITLPSGLTSIGNEAFCGCTALESISIPASVTSIGCGVFASCASLESITLPSGITSISNEAFMDCTKLESISISKGVTSIGESAFRDCKALQSISIPTSVTSIGRLAFAGCKALQSISIPKNVTSIGEGAFSCCTKLEKIGVSADNAKYSAKNNVLFNKNQTELLQYPLGNTDKSYTVPSSVTKIQYASFCASNLTSVCIPKSVKRIDAYAFQDPALKDVYYSGTEAEWGNVQINDFGDYDTNKPLKNVTIHYNSTGPNSNTASTSKKGTFKYYSQFTDTVEEYNYSYNEEWFSNNSSNYIHGLAQMSLRMAMASYDVGSACNGDRSKGIRDLFSQLGFDYIDEIKTDTSSSNDTIYYPKSGDNTIGYAIGVKKITCKDGKTYNLVAVMPRSGNYKAEWAGNFTVGSATEHQGFATGANKVFKALKTYLKDNNLTSNLKVWVAGYSRGAAVSNILAQRITAAAKNGEIKGLKENNVFAYCFECPQTVMTTDIAYKSNTYKNIKNIVNPTDLVTKVAPSLWDYSRYGITYCIPASDTTFSNYKASFDAMVKNYTQILKKASIKSPDSKALLATYHMPAQTLFTNELFDTLALHAGGFKLNGLDAAGYYVLANQNSFVKIGREIGSKGFSLDVIPTIIVETAKSIPEFVPLHPFLIDQVIINGKALGYAHYPELCLAWMDTLKSDADYKNARTRKLVINCPVDITVTDSSGKTVAKITDDVVQEISDSTISAYVDEDGQKIVILPRDEKFNVKVKATDKGTMSYQVEEFSADTGAVDKIKGYYDVKINKGDTLTGTVENISKSQDAEYPLKNAKGEKLSGKVKTGEEANKLYAISISGIDGAELNGGGVYSYGEYATVSANTFNGHVFKGWYEGEKLVSSDNSYKFKVTKDRDLVAKYKASKFPFKDVAKGSFCYDAVQWAYYNNPQITAGVDATHFAPNNSCTRGQIVTFLWRANGCPDVSGVKNPFKDVSKDAFYYKAVLWAVSKGITNGVDATHFAPNNTCTRGQAVTFLWRADNQPKAAITKCPFKDVKSSAFYYKAMMWAVGEEITNGIDATHFAPNNTCTRGQIVTFLYRDMK